MSAKSRGRVRPEAMCSIRTVFQRDRDRIIHSKSFRRLKHKTQVLLLPESDHPRTRLTHTLEVSQIARTIARALRLNEDLTEAIALGHDLGHTPFGHMGERVLRDIAVSEGLPAFHHAAQSLRVVDFLEREGKGLNLTWEVRMGIIQHSKGQVDVRGGFNLEDPSTVEAWVVRVSDSIAYLNHDLDDALGAGLLSKGDVPREITENLGASHGMRIDTLVKDVITNSPEGRVCFSGPILEQVEVLRNFLNDAVYNHKSIKAEEPKVANIIKFLYEYEREAGLEAREAIDEISGMTDRYALHLFRSLAEPNA
jgi:dGTPase